MRKLLDGRPLGYDACPYFVSEDIDGDGVVEFAFVEAEGRFVSLLKADTWQETWRRAFDAEGGPGVTYLVDSVDLHDGGGRKIIAAIGRSLYLLAADGRVERMATFPERMVKCLPCRLHRETGFYASFDAGTVRLLSADFDVAWRKDFRGTFEDHAPLYIGDIDGDGSDEAVVSLTDRKRFYVVDEDSRILWDRPVPEGDTHLDSVAIEDIDGKQVFLFDSRRPAPSCMLVDCRGSILWRREFSRQICPCRTIRWKANEVSFSVCEQLQRPERGPFHAWILDSMGSVRDSVDFDSEPCAAVMYHDWTGCSNTNEVDIDRDGADELALLAFDSRLYVFGSVRAP